MSAVFSYLFIPDARLFADETAVFWKLISFRYIKIFCVPLNLYYVYSEMFK
jgi:hypothetical protein